MGAFKWSLDQLKAIETRGKNILVSAAAGAGKTSVLVERIRKMISEEEVPVRQFLVVTFTNDAAAEMKDRLRMALTSELRSLEKGSSRAAFLRKQLLDLDSAYITTFHSFGLKVIRRFFYKLDLEPGFSISEPVDSQVMMEMALDEVLETEFEKGEKDFISFMDAYSGDRSNWDARQMILDAYSDLITMPHAYDWMEEKIEEIEAAEKDIDNSVMWSLIRQDIKGKLRDVASSYEIIIGMLDSVGMDYVTEKIKAGEVSCIHECEELLNSGKPAGEILEEIDNVLSQKGTTIKARKEDQAIYDEIKSDVQARKTKIKEFISKRISHPYLSADIDVLVKQSVLTVPYLRTLRRLVMAFDDAYAAIKRERGVLDFNDIEHYCFSALEDEEVASFYRESIFHIFVDEYQDTNLMQEAIIGKIKRENNLFMVGDIKQCIYRFRLAEPSIFQGKYEDYSDGSIPDSMVINLNENHRSKPGIINAVNKVFETIMEGYDEDAKLKGKEECNEEYVFSPSLKVLVPEKDNELDLNAAEMEAYYVADIILDNLGKPFYDTSGTSPVVRPLELGDMVILMRAVSGKLHTFREILKEKGIDSQIDDGEDYFDALEVLGFLDLLKVIDNVRRDISLIGVLRNDVFGFTPNELSEIRIRNRKGSFSDAFLSLYEEADGKEKKDALENKVWESYNRIKEWKEMAKTMSVATFIWELLLDSGLFSIMGALPGGDERQANLKALCTIAENFSEQGKGTLFDFLQYVDSIKTGSIKVPKDGEEKNSNCIRIKTIHKSKGLEYPMVILSRLGAGFRGSEGKRFSMHRDIGVGIRLVDRKNLWSTNTIMEYLIDSISREEALQEEIRILYVAMTRARDKLFMVASQKDDKFRQLADLGLLEWTQYIRLLAPILPYEVSYFDLTDKRMKKGEEDEAKTVYDAEEIIERLDFSYDDKERMLKSKYSATDLNEKEGASVPSRLLRKRSIAGRLSKELDREIEKRSYTPSERGTIYHKILERLPFRDAANLGPKEIANFVRKGCEKLVSQGILTVDELEGVDITRIEEFFLSDLGIRAAKADSLGRLEKERPFTLALNKDGKDILVQGIIDCYFTEIHDGEEKTVLLDYKSNRIYEDIPLKEEEERLKAAYSTQLAIYKEALEVAGMCNVCEVYLYLLDIGHSFLL